MAEIFKPVRWTARGYLLYLLPLPLVPAVLVAVLRGNLTALLYEVTALVLLYGGAWLTRQGLLRELSPRRRYARRLPLKTVGAIAVAAGTFVASHYLVGQTLTFAAVLAVLAACGCLLAYGTDAPAARPELAPGADYTAEEASAMLDEAERRVEGIERAAAAIREGELASRLCRIAALARTILASLEQDPRDLRRARKFLNIYLDSARRVSEAFARTHEQAASAELEGRFRNVLVTIEQAFGEQQRKLLENDVLDLDIQIEVLKTQLEKEGVA